jgi:hypothetical protein
MKSVLLLSLLIMAALLVTAGCSSKRAGYKTAPYTLSRTSGSFEVRDYPAMMAVETLMTGTEGDAGFSRLFRFISGRNAKAQKIAMTTPVLMSGDETNRTMAFVMPADLQPDRVPTPADAALSVRQIQPGRFAVLRFSGARSPKREEAALAQLKTWMAAEGLGTSSPPVYGYFDPPWTPPFLRRNEVMLRLDPRPK